MLPDTSIDAKHQGTDQIEQSSHIFAFTRLEFVPKEARNAFSLIFGSGMTVSRGYAHANSCFGFNSACRGSSPNACAALLQFPFTICYHLSQLSSGVQRGQHRTNQLYMSKVHPFDLIFSKFSQLPIPICTYTAQIRYLPVSCDTNISIFQEKVSLTYLNTFLSQLPQAHLKNASTAQMTYISFTALLYASILFST
uniref:Uncharacterized protein n=1 Tax=Spironucleus salmonicida TaxID=348837 RepID=V6LDN0_9EUKA|eukprot:EST42358.1 Hypothetical protein SS50377_18087 [Spironucleus salmonicida]